MEMVKKIDLPFVNIEWKNVAFFGKYTHLSTLRNIIEIIEMQTVNRKYVGFMCYTLYPIILFCTSFKL